MDEQNVTHKANTSAAPIEQEIIEPTSLESCGVMDEVSYGTPNQGFSLMENTLQL